jgi:hypothetical protein
VTCRILAILLASLEDLNIDYVAFRSTEHGKIALIVLTDETDASRIAGALGVGMEETGDDTHTWLFATAVIEGVALNIRGPTRKRAPQLEAIP